jgi:DNA-directed RNA polymerase subunit RPC12/RpoP
MECQECGGQLEEQFIGENIRDAVREVRCEDCGERA